MDARTARLFYFFAGCVGIFSTLYGPLRIHYGLPHMWPLWVYMFGAPVAAYCFWRWWVLCEENEDE